MSENLFSTMFKFSFRKKKDKKFVSTGTSFRNTYGFFCLVFCLLGFCLSVYFACRVSKFLTFAKQH